MFKSLENYNRGLAAEFSKLVKRAEFVKTAEHEECEEGDCLMEAVEHLNKACELLEEKEGMVKVCKKIKKAIKLLGKFADLKGFVKEINKSEDVEEEVQEEVEEQQE